MKKNLDPKRPLFVTVERDGTPAEKQAARKLDAALTRLVEDYGYASVLRGIARLSTEAVSRREKHADDSMPNFDLDAVRRECRLIGFRVYSVSTAQKIRLRASETFDSACWIEVASNEKFIYHRKFIPEAEGCGNIARRNDVIEAVERYEAKVDSILATMNKASHTSEVFNLLGTLLSLLEHIDRCVRSLVIV